MILSHEMTQNTEVYFATRKPEETTSILLAKAKSFYNTLQANFYLEKLRLMWRAYHGVYGKYDSEDNHIIKFVGEQGEFVHMPVNHFRNLARHIYIMITSNRPVMDCRAMNTDYKSISQTYLGNGILEYYMREQHLEDYINKATEMAVVLGSGFIKMGWNSTAGSPVDGDQQKGKIYYQGEAEFSNLSPFDVVVDGTKESFNDNDWMLCRTYKNRFNLMAKYPELADKIKGLQPKNGAKYYRLGMFSNDDTDDIPIHEFFHKRNEALPNGRYILFLDSEIVLLDSNLPYREIPVFRISASDIMGTPYSYSEMFDIYPIQEAMNTVYSTVLTNQVAHGVQNVWVPKGADINLMQLEGGMNVIESTQKPEPLNLTQTAAETFKFLEILVQASETLSGISSVTRGNPEASLHSGNALALVQSMSLQFSSGLQQSYVKLIEGVGTSLINILKDFATSPRIAAIVGKNNKTYLKEFTGEDINAINRVVVDVGNPLSRSIAGRVEMAQQLLQMGVVKTAEQYIQVLNTGRLDAMYEGEMKESLLIQKENERLSEGTSIKVSPTDRHRLHIVEHKTILSDPDLREDDTLVKIVFDHIEQHMDALRNTDPDLLAMVGEQALQPLTPPAGNPSVTPVNPNQESGNINDGSADKILANNIQGSNKVTPPGITPGPGQKPQTLPTMPKPPAPFKNNPVSPQNMIPPGK